MKYSVNILLTAVLLLFSTRPATAQTNDFKKMREDLVEKQQDTRSEIDELNEQIVRYEERLEKAEEKYDRLYNQYEDLRRLIALQDQKISKLTIEQQHIKEEIAITEAEIEERENQLERLIENYKETLTYLYKHGRSSNLALIFSANSLNQMLIRTYYLNRFEEYRMNQVTRIRDIRQELSKNKERLENARDKNIDVLAEIRAEKKRLAEKKERQENNVAMLRQNRDQIENSLQEFRRQKEKLNNTLTSLILREERIRQEEEERIRLIEEERKRKLAAARNIDDEVVREQQVARYSEPILNENYLDNSTLDQIETAFAAKKGELPWPVESNTISEHYGLRRHPVYGTVTKNLGIEIVTKSKEVVRAIHDGHVFAIMPFTGYGDVVLVNHGKYKTVYGNLSEVLVQKNSVVKAGDIIGLSGDEDSARGESLFFMIREGTDNLNPETWLANQ
ncbi:MAG: peptidoglycan DD-metalloendopeptidase family protein [Balneolaceae bacterium]|nr:peptidoglycan DD-metalloendopeptidase family protein [Balneolaceae bacterium]